MDKWKLDSENQSLGEHIQVYMSRAQVLTLARLVRSDMKKAQRRLAKSDFVPEEGRRHGDESRINKMERLLSLLLDYAEVASLDEGDPRRSS